MFPLYTLDEFLNMAEEDFTTEELINLYDPSENLYNLVQKSPLCEDYLWISCHSNSNTFGVLVFENGRPISRERITTEEMNDIILNSGLWHGQDIVFLACYSGLEGGPAQKVAQILDSDISVYGPTARVYFKPSGFFYVSETSLHVGDPELEPEIQIDRWIEY